MLSKSFRCRLGDGSTALHMQLNLQQSRVCRNYICLCDHDYRCDNGYDDAGDGHYYYKIYKTEIDRNAGDQKVLKISKSVTFIFALPTLIPAFLIPSQSLTNLFLTLQHVAAAPVSFRFWQA